MKIIVSSSDYLFKELNAINGVITTNPIIPILENFLFEVENKETLTVTASDNQTSMIAELHIEADEDGAIAIPSRMLLDTLKNLTNQSITLSVDKDTYMVEIISENGRYKLAGENATDFPKIPMISDGQEIKISSEILTKAIQQTLFATSTDEVKPSLTGVYMNMRENDTIFVGSDLYVLSKYQNYLIKSPQKHEMIVPRKVFSLLKNIIPNEPLDIALNYNKSNIILGFKNKKMMSRLIDEYYPDYETVIPLENNHTIYLDRHLFLSALKRVAIYANKSTHLIHLSFVLNELNMSAVDFDYKNEANETINCEHFGEDIKIGFDAKKLIEIINTIDDDEIKIEMSESNKACIFSTKEVREDEAINILLMPLKI